MRKKILFLIAMILITLIWIPQGYSLKKGTHEAINQEIAQRTINGFSLDGYLKNNLGFEGGSEEPVYGYSGKKKQYGEQKVWEWLGEGGWMEDIPVWRAFRHFHNPLEPWDSAGLKGSTLGRSSIIWAQSLDQSYGNYAWQDVRNYFYLALTSLDKTTRESYFAETFRGLGQQMHLVEDASVIMHARDDIHIFYSYETWVENLRNRDRITFGIWLANAITYDNSILNLSPNPLAPIPIARILDTDSYDGTNPDITSGLNIGISEYTNANFFSDDTINSSDFPYPDIDQTTVIERAAPSGNYQRQYYLKNCCGETNGGQGYLLSAVDYLDYYRQQYPLLSVALPIIPVLDDNVYADYAPLLIPRAVGYSAGLMNYFFRGTLEITPPDSYVYSITDGSDTPYNDNGNLHQQFTHIKAKVRNTTPKEVDVNGNTLTYEDMLAGSIRAVAKYKIVPDYMPDLSNYPPVVSTVDNVPNNMRDVTYSYSVSAPITIASLSNTMPEEFIFDFTNDPIPAGITNLSLQVIFKGTLGNEQYIAIAAGFKDLMEPTHQVFWNLTDMFSLYDDRYGAYRLYTAVEIRSDSRLLNLASGAYIDPHDIMFEFSYADQLPPSGNLFKSAEVLQYPLPQGRFVRLIVLVDDAVNNYLRITYSDNIDTSNQNDDFVFEGVINHEENGNWQPPSPIPAISFRDVNQHFGTGYLRCKPTAINPETGAAYCPYPEEEAIPADLTPYPAIILFPDVSIIQQQGTMQIQGTIDLEGETKPILLPISP